MPIFLLAAPGVVADVPPTPVLSTTQLASPIWERPRVGSAQLGYLRAGARLVRAQARYEGSDAQPCGGTWYAVEPYGFVCVGRDGVTLDLDDPRVAAAGRYPPGPGALPYAYGVSRGARAYTRVPRAEDRSALEREGPAPPDPSELALPLEPEPDFLTGHVPAPPVLPGLDLPASPFAGWIDPRVRLAFLSAFEDDGRPYYLTTEHLVVPAERMRAERPSDFSGVEIGPRARLPMIWVRTSSLNNPVYVYELRGTAIVRTEVELAFQTHASVADAEVNVGGLRFHELLTPHVDSSARKLVRASDVARVDAVGTLPKDVAEGETWIDVNLRTETLVLYRGKEPVFVTLVSTGSGETDHTTPWGAFRIYQKHISARMSAESKPGEGEGHASEPGYRFDDVPWVQYFFGGVALHAAFWHERFGLPVSHGCVNLSPRDARYLFERTLPAVPAGWHGIFAGDGGIPRGTLVVVHG